MYLCTILFKSVSTFVYNKIENLGIFRKKQGKELDKTNFEFYAVLSIMKKSTEGESEIICI